MEYESIPAHAHRPELTAKFDFRKEMALLERLNSQGQRLALFKGTDKNQL